MRKVKVSFRPSEIEHLLSLIQTNEETGEYSGNLINYLKRSERIKAKLEEAQYRDNVQ